MANCDEGKIKVLLLYDYFTKYMNAYEDCTVGVGELKEYLKAATGYTFERKSIYADIKKLNDFAVAAGLVEAGDEWIYTEQKKYRVNQLKGQLTMDEARLLVDAVNTTSFVGPSIASKVKGMFPSYFASDRSAMRELVKHDDKSKTSAKTMALLNNIRMAISDSAVLEFNYGYRLGKELISKEKRVVSPLALDWANNNYYLIAFDNKKFDECIKAGRDVKYAIRRYRIDRMDTSRFVTGEKSRKFPTARDRREAIKLFEENAINAFSSDRMVDFTVTLEYSGTETAEAQKSVLKAYSILADQHMNIGRVDDTKLSRGILTFHVSAADVPTLYTILFQVGTVDSVDMKIGDGPVKTMYLEYIDRIKAALS